MVALAPSLFIRTFSAACQVPALLHPTPPCPSFRTLCEKVGNTKPRTPSLEPPWRPDGADRFTASRLAGAPLPRGIRPKYDLYQITKCRPDSANLRSFFNNMKTRVRNGESNFTKTANFWRLSRNKGCQSYFRRASILISSIGRPPFRPASSVVARILCPLSSFPSSQSFTNRRRLPAHAYGVSRHGMVCLLHR
jgi:hypothetical protein